MMVRREDLEELAQVLRWGETADAYVLILDDAIAGRVPVTDERLKSKTEAARALLKDLSEARNRSTSPSFDRLSVYSAAASNLVETGGAAALDLGKLEGDLESLDGGGRDALGFLQAGFEVIGEAMHQAALDLSSREPAWQF